MTLMSNLTRMETAWGTMLMHFPENKYVSNWSTVYTAVGTLIAILIGLEQLSLV